MSDLKNSQPEGDRVLQALAQMYARSTATATPSERDGFLKIAENVAPTAFSRPPNSMRVLSIGFGVAALAAGLFWAIPSRLTYQIGDVNALAVQRGPAELRADGPSSLPVTFSEGSELRLAAHSAGRLADVGRLGARVVLDYGELRARVVHKPGARWFVDAGPFQVAVKGTEFDVAWATPKMTLDVRLHTGSVVVSGPLTGEGFHLKPGSHLIIDLRSGSVQLKSLEAPVAASAQPTLKALPHSPAEAPDFSQLSPPITQHRPRMPSRVNSPLSPDRWPLALQQGHYADIVDAAQSQGLASIYRNASAPSLRALADAARFSRRLDVAEPSLRSLRQRFPTATGAKDAAFFLGWIADESGATAEALRWYDVYLERGVRPAYGEQALGRKMLLVEKRQGREAAREVSSLYLRRHPGGTYAAAARRIQSAQ